MRIRVKVKPSAKVQEVTQLDQPGLFGSDKEPFYRISVKEPAKEGKANEAVLRALAKHLNITAGRLKIVRGLKSRNKTIEIL